MNSALNCFLAFTVRRTGQRGPVVLIVCFSISLGLSQSAPAFQLPPEVSMAAGMIKEERYDDAANKLRQFLDARPNDPEALTLLATAQVYKEKDYVKGKGLFEEVIKQGGGASFFVGHSHEKTVMSIGDPTDYCRGWLHLRKGKLIFVPDNGDHRLELAYSEIKDFGQNNFKKLFHLKTVKDKDGKERNYNFAPRSRNDAEVLLIVVMYQKISRQ